MTADVIAWLDGPEGEQWSLERAQAALALGTSPAPRYWKHSPGEPSEDPCGRPPLGTGETTAGGAA